MMKCPTCGNPVDLESNPSRPFCSERCKLIDFGRWADEQYSVPSNEPMPAAENPGTTPAPGTPDDLS
ncbi:MAG TPA: DNA gyrase inhibitor YacG [Pyrinomonadaceae bacterium]